MLLNPKNIGRETKILSNAFLELVKIVKYNIKKLNKYLNILFLFLMFNVRANGHIEASQKPA